MDINQANRNIMIAWVLSAVGHLLWFVLLLVLPPVKFDPHIFIPFGFSVITVLPLILTYTVYRKSRVGAVLLFTIYVLDRLFLFPWLYLYSRAFIIIWLCIALLWAFIFVQGIRGTFAYHRLKDEQASHAV